MKKLVRYCYYLAAVLLFKLVQLFPYRFAVRFGGLLGLWAYYIVADARKNTENNLALSFPEKDSSHIKGIAREVFINQGKNLFELFYYPKLTAADLEKIVSMPEAHILMDPVRAKKGVIMAAAHCGNWEIMGAAMATSGMPMHVIARKIYIEQLNDMLLNFRYSKGLKIILRTASDSARKMLQALKNSEILAMLIDQDTDVPGVFVHFFGRPAWTPSGLAAIALRTGAEVVLSLDVRKEDDTHQPEITRVDMVKTGDTDKDILDNTQRITKMIEDHIRRYPSQWVWMHNRWKTKPKSTA